MNPSVLRGPVFLLVTSLLLIIAPASHGQTPPTQVPPLDVATNAPPSAPAAAPQPAGVTPAPSAGSTANATPVSSGDIKVINGPGDLSPTTKPFVHPGIYYTASDLAFMRKKLADKAEPWTSAWEKNKPTASDDSWTPHAVAEWDCNAGGGPTTNGFYLFGDPMVAHREALAWAMTGSQANADVAIKILNAWASTLQSIKTFSMPQQKLATGACFAQLCNAAELLVYGGPDGKSSGWSNDDIQKFKTMLQIPYGAMKGFMPGFNGNWDLIMTDSMMSMAVFSDDHNMFDEALQHYIVGTTPNGGLPNYVYESGQCQESYRDEGHVQWGLGNAVAVCQIAWNQGIDIYSAYDNRLLKGLEYTARFNLGNDVPYDGKGVISQKGRGQFAFIWELPYQHYVIEKGLEMPYTKQIIESNSVKTGFAKAPGAYRPEGDFIVGINWGTFTMYKGDEDPQAAKK